jgi:hypothetical protein
LGCGHSQQVIWMLFNAVENGAAIAGDTDQAFLDGQLYLPALLNWLCLYPS